MTNQEKLASAVRTLKHEHQTVPLRKRKGMCLQMTRNALTLVGVSFPWNDYPNNTASGCFLDLKDNPGYWRWETVHHPLPEYALVFFGACGYLADGRMAGHIGILNDGVIYSDTPRTMTKWWGARLKWAGVPK